MTTITWLWMLAGVAVLVVLPLVSCLAGALTRRRNFRRAAGLLADCAPTVLARPIPTSRCADRGPVERWLAADGPTPTAGWWQNGGLAVDELGPALFDAAGLRHALPAATATMVRLPAPRALLLLDGRANLVARLPTSFAEADLVRLCAAAGWRYDLTAGWGRDGSHTLDLRDAVVDRAARDAGLAARLSAAVRRHPPVI